MAEFKIAKVSTAAPREWSFKDRRTGSDVPMETYKVMLEGEDDPVDINRKPGNAPAAGELLTGTIEDSDFGKKFKPERKPFTPGGAPKDTAEIKAEWAIGQANAYLSTEKDKSLS